jgi:murein DD-endopeptidase MepM/ murein hydrolase activator NlpD
MTRHPLTALAMTVLLLGVLATATATPAGSRSRPVASSAAPRFTWPLAPPHPVIRPFQAPTTPYGPGHRGVDLADQLDAPVLAAGDGTVAFAGPVAGRGVVSIDHPGGLRTTYEPLAAVVVAGQRLTVGSVIGRLMPGHAGCTQPCLHWGARRGAEYVDPLGLLSSGRVRLLPWDQTSVFSSSLARSRSTARVWSWHTRDSVTPRTRPISARVRFSK